MDGAGEGAEEAHEDWDDGIDEEIAVIIDNGSGVCKAGLSSESLPTAVFPACVGRPRKSWQSSWCRDKIPPDADIAALERELASLDREVYVGDEVTERCAKLSINYPLENGIIENFDHMERLWEYAFLDKLNVNPQRHPVLLTEPPYNPKPNREKMVEIMFEVFGVPTLNISIQGVLALLGQGRTTGLVLDSGEGVTHTIPIFDGFGLPHCINRMDIAGRELNTLLAKFIAHEGVSLTRTVDQHQVREMKERHCYCALDPSSEFAERVTYRLPDNTEVSLTDERWRCPEALFKPSMVGLESESPGVAGMVWDSISRCDIDIRRTLLSNVVLSGGSTMFKGFSERLAKELRQYAPTASQAGIRVVSSESQKYAVWSGAQVFASLRSMQEDQWIDREDYYEYGVQFIHDKIAVRYS